MQEYRNLRKQEIDILESKNCKCETWQNVKVAQNFNPEHLKNVTFSGDIQLGTVENKPLWISNP